MPTVIDISNANGAVDWKRVAASGIQGAYIKLSEGVTFDDPNALDHANAARGAGIPFGFYHFARPDNNPPEAEVDHVVRRLAKLNGLKPEFKVALDLEKGAPNPTAAIGDWAHRFSQALHAKLGYFPIFYSFGPFIDGLKLSKPVGSGLWLAAFGRDDGVEHPFSIPAPWKRAVMHQFSSRAHVAGVQGFVDLSNASSLRPLRVS